MIILCKPVSQLWFIIIFLTEKGGALLEFFFKQGGICLPTITKPFGDKTSVILEVNKYSLVRTEGSDEPRFGEIWSDFRRFQSAQLRTCCLFIPHFSVFHLPPPVIQAF